MNELRNRALSLSPSDFSDFSVCLSVSLSFSASVSQWLQEKGCFTHTNDGLLIEERRKNYAAEMQRERERVRMYGWMDGLGLCVQIIEREGPGRRERKRWRVSVERE